MMSTDRLRSCKTIEGGQRKCTTIEGGLRSWCTTIEGGLRRCTTIEGGLRKCTTIEGGRQLPGEIWHDIFCRLPVESLSGCRFVCKYWYNLIVKNPTFVDLYNSAATSLFVVRYPTSLDKQIFYLVDINQNNPNPNSTSLKAFNVYLDNARQFDAIDIVGSFNGLLCLCSLPDYDLIYICNPVTREMLKLPKPVGLDPDCQTNNNFKFLCSTSAGFAFHAPTNTYKVVHTWYFYTKGTRLLQTGIEIYTVGSGIWRRIDQCNIYLACKNSSVSQVYLNGALHLKMETRTDPKMQFCIGAIDIGDENFTTFLQPYLEHKTKTRTLSSLHQYLCLTDEFDDYMIIWIMKQYGVAGSWTRQHLITKEILPRPLQTTVSLNTSTAMKNGCVLIHGGEHKGYYDLENHEYKSILIEGIQPQANGLDFVLHVGSLISLKSLAGTGEDYQFPSTIPRRHVKFTLKRKKLHQNS